jgi:Pentapeptide repeats (8 copies)
MANDLRRSQSEVSGPVTGLADTDTVPPKADIASTQKFASKAYDLEALQGAIVDAAGVSAGLWFSYLFVLLYFAIAVGSVTHRDLFYENPIKLPFLSTDLPLVSFFVLGPLLLLIVHSYVMLHIVLLGDKVNSFNNEFERQLGNVDEKIREGLRLQLPLNSFVQLLAGPSEAREGLRRSALFLVACISLLISPLALLLLFQLQFLPFHQELITWGHRLAVIADLMLVWWFWRSMAKAPTTRQWNLRRLGRAVAATASLILLLLVFGIATFPGEGLEKELAYVPSGLRWLHDRIIVGDVDWNTNLPTSLWPNSNHLVLPGLDMTNDSAALGKGKSLRARHLEGAVLIGAKLSNADFTAAFLQGARFDSADLVGATFGSAHLQAAKFAYSNLQGADLNKVELCGADLGDAELGGAKLEDARLRGANLQHTKLQGAAPLEDGQLEGLHLQCE